MQKMEPLSFGNYYHIYNRGIAKANLFYKKGNYEHFQNLYKKYIDPITDTFAYCMMPNHFHLLVRIKEEEEIGNLSEFVDSVPNEISFLNADRSLNPNRVPNPVGVAIKNKKIRLPHFYFSDLFNSYSQAINKQENRTGSLFQRPFKRKKIETEAHLKQLVIYIHTNPIKHGFVKHCKDYPWSSYHDIISAEPTNIKREQVLNWFDNVADFIKIHNNKTDLLMDEKIVSE
jgi:REP element-mobilizing transposase RayT